MTRLDISPLYVKRHCPVLLWLLQICRRCNIVSASNHAAKYSFHKLQQESFATSASGRSSQTSRWGRRMKGVVRASFGVILEQGKKGVIDRFIGGHKIAILISQFQKFVSTTTRIFLAWLGVAIWRNRRHQSLWQKCRWNKYLRFWIKIRTNVFSLRFILSS